MSTSAHEQDQAIAIVEHLYSIDPKNLTDLVASQMSSLTEDERVLVDAAVLYAYNAIVGGAALAAATT